MAVGERVWTRRVEMLVRRLPGQNVDSGGFVRYQGTEDKPLIGSITLSTRLVGALKQSKKHARISVEI